MKKINERLSGDLKHSAFQKAAEYTRQPGNPEDINPLLYKKRKVQADSFSTHINPGIKAEANVIAKMFGADFEVSIHKGLDGTPDEPYIVLNFGKNIAVTQNSEFNIIIQKNTHKINKKIFVPENIERRLANFIKKIQNVELPNEELIKENEDTMFVGDTGSPDNPFFIEFQAKKHKNDLGKIKELAQISSNEDPSRMKYVIEVPDGYEISDFPAKELNRNAIDISSFKDGIEISFTGELYEKLSIQENKALLKEVSRMKVLAGILNEIKANELYFDTFSAAVQHARIEAENKGYVIDESDWFNRVSTGPGKPSEGETTRFSIALTKNGIPQNKQLSVQVYGMRSGRYELNFYIS